MDSDNDLKDALRLWFFLVIFIPWLIVSAVWILGIEISDRAAGKKKRRDVKDEKKRESTIIYYA